VPFDYGALLRRIPGSSIAIPRPALAEFRVKLSIFAAGFEWPGSLRQRLRASAAARIAQQRVIDRFPGNLLFEPDFLGWGESVGIVERRSSHIGDLGVIGVCVRQRCAAAGAEPSLDAGRGFECGGFAAREGEIRRSKDNPRQWRRAGCPAATSAVTHHERRRRRGDPVANRAAQAAAFVNRGCFHMSIPLYVAEQG